MELASADLRFSQTDCVRRYKDEYKKRGRPLDSIESFSGQVAEQMVREQVRKFARGKPSSKRKEPPSASLAATSAKAKTKAEPVVPRREIRTPTRTPTRPSSKRVALPPPTPEPENANANPEKKYETEIKFVQGNWVLSRYWPEQMLTFENVLPDVVEDGKGFWSLWTDQGDGQEYISQGVGDCLAVEMFPLEEAEMDLLVGPEPAEEDSFAEHLKYVNQLDELGAGSPKRPKPNPKPKP